jgi:hypothetical protein
VAAHFISVKSGDHGNSHISKECRLRSALFLLYVPLRGKLGASVFGEGKTGWQEFNTLIEVRGVDLVVSLLNGKFKATTTSLQADQT